MRVIESITEKHQLLSLPDPLHPLVSVVRVSDIQFTDSDIWKKFSVNFYCISLKKNVAGKTKYGQGFYDYNKGVMTFISPRQIMSLDESQSDILNPASGYALFVHPDFLYNHPLANAIRNYGFFSYAINEALHLSENEEKDIEDIFLKIEKEYQHIDKHTQNIIISQLELLLNFSNRFYERQFITRKRVNHDILTRLELELDMYLDQKQTLQRGLPTVEFLAERLNLSPSYLSDLLRTLTGQTAQQHIQEKLILRAKEYLSLETLSVAEIAYELGFERPQSFNRLFKRKTNMSPLTFRKSFK